MNKLQGLEHQQPLFELTWEQDYDSRTNPPMFTQRLREQVPVLEYVNWEICSVAPGEVETLLPLNPPSTNQHFTHQAALIVLSADYSGGAALASLFWGWPVIGVHPVDSPKSVSMWLLKVEMKYLKPSTADLCVRASVDESRREKIQRRFLSGKPVIETLSMKFMNGNDVVAEGTCTYFARQSTALRGEGVDSGKINSLFALKLTSSAEMIAGVRALQSGTLFSDPYAESMAGQHGMAVATRFCQRTPQLGGMVASRTKHLDEVLKNFVAAGGRHIVNVGVGWDMRPFRLELPPGTIFYELDFPTTLDERAVRLKRHNISDQPNIERVQIPIDLRKTSVCEALVDRLPHDRPVLIMWEGMSMYFQETEVKDILSDMRKLMAHPDSVLWVDIVDRGPIVDTEAFPTEVQNFMHGMQVLGEPFTFGCDRPEDFIEGLGLRCLEVVTSDVYFADAADPVFSIYQFCTISGDKTSGRLPVTFRPAAIAKVATPINRPHFALPINHTSPAGKSATSQTT